MKEQKKKILELAKAAGYQIKNLHTFKGMEEMGGFNAVLYRQGKSIANLINDDSGGETMWNGLNPEEEAKIKFLCSQVPDYYDKQFNITLKCDMETFAWALVHDHQDENFFHRKCKTHTVVFLKSLEDGEYIEYRSPYNEKLASDIRTKYKDDLKEIVNERFLKESGK